MAKKKGFIQEFKDFISRGNVLDMAVGVIIATAFGAITTTLVNKVIMPVIGLIFGGQDFTNMLNWTVKEAVMEGGEVVKEAVVIGFGDFVAAILNFVIIAFIVFCIVKAFNKAREAAEKRKKEEAPAEEAPAEPEPSKEEVLLTEIRDLLKNK